MAEFYGTTTPDTATEKNMTTMGWVDYGLVTPYAVMKHGQHWFGIGQLPDGTKPLDVEQSSAMSRGLPMKALLQKILNISNIVFFISKTTNLRLYQHSHVVNELIRVIFLSWSVTCKLLKEEWRSNSSELPIGAAVIAFRQWLHYFYRASGAKLVTSNIRKICEQFPIFVLLGSSHQEACAINTKNYWHMNILRSHDMLHMPIFWLVLRG